jgi:hypothetical protein
MSSYDKTHNVESEVSRQARRIADAGGDNGRMISTALAQQLRDAGLDWTPVSGDAFQIARPDFEGDLFTVSDMTIEAHSYSTGTVLGFNGTTEWALDSVALDDALWMPREDQLRDLLRGTFDRLDRTVGADGRVAYAVTTSIEGVAEVFASDDPAEAYGLALLALIRRAGAAEA